MAKPSRRKREADLAYKAHRNDLIATSFNRTITFVFLAVIAYFLHASIIALAGKETFADVGLKLLADLKISQGVAYVLGVGGAAYGWRQRKLRKDNIERMAFHAQELERSLDPKRSTSRLTPRGDTNPEDRK